MISKKHPTVSELLGFGGTMQMKLPLFETSHLSEISEDELKKIDLNTYLIPNPDSTIFVKVTSGSTHSSAVNKEDILIVDRSVPPAENKLVVVFLENEYVVRTIKKTKNAYTLVTDDNDETPLILQEDSSINLLGVVTHIIHSV